LDREAGLPHVDQARGHPRALKLFGFGKKAEVTATLEAAPQRLVLGGSAHADRRDHLHVITSTQRLAIDYVVHYVKARGVSAEKVFKWTEVDLPAWRRSN
jgi:hypothetical protein